MKKKAFTLAETLITLGIIGIIAAIIAPLVGNIKPDANKAMYLKSYDALAHNIKKFVHNSSIYAPTYKYGGQTFQIESYPLLDFNKPVNKDFQDQKYSGTTKLGNLLEDALGGKHVQGHDIGNSATTFENGYNFTTNNGVQWWIQPSANPYANMTNNGISFYNKISIDVNGEEGPNAYYSAASSQTPDRFDFYITASGNVIPSDVYGQMYVDRRRNFLKRKEDLTGYSAITVNGISDVQIALTDLGVTLPDGGKGNVTNESNGNVTTQSNGNVTNESNGNVTNESNGNASNGSISSQSNGGSSATNRSDDTTRSDDDQYPSDDNQDYFNDYDDWDFPDYDDWDYDYGW